MPGVSIAVMPAQLTTQPTEVIHSMVDAMVDDVIAALTRPLDVSEPIKEIVTLPDEVLRFEGTGELDALDRMNRQFLEYGWSDGFPLVAPTPEAVEKMLTGTSRNRYDVVATLEPGFGIGTVEKIAINAVMAGCRPEHLPVVIAAVQCIAEPVINLRNKAMSTGPHAPLILVNGPIAKKLKVNSGVCALGPGAPSYANSVIGRALRLVMMNVGHTYPTISDMDTVGSPTKYSMCAAENEEASPWEPFHVEHGFPKDASTVTVHFSYGICELHDFGNYEPDKLADTFSSAAMNMAQPGSGMWLIGRRADPRSGTNEKEHSFMFICPDHARNFARAKWSKDDLREYMYKNARLPFSKVIAKREKAGMMVAHPELQWLFDAPETVIPILETPDCFDIAVVGVAAGRGTYFYGAGAPVIKPVEP